MQPTGSLCESGVVHTTRLKLAPWSPRICKAASAEEHGDAAVQIAEAHPRFLRRQLSEVVEAMLQIAGAEALDDATRQLAAEFLVTLCEAREKAPGMMRKLPAFAEAIFRIMLSFLLDIEVSLRAHRRCCCAC